MDDALAQVVITSEGLQMELRRQASEAAQLAEEMDFGLLYNGRKKLYRLDTTSHTPAAHGLL